MERRGALVAAGTLAASLVLAGGALAMNLGLLGAGQQPVGHLSPTAVQPATPSPDPVRVIVPTDTRPPAVDGDDDEHDEDEHDDD
jgi:hypothetical protein